MGLSATCSVTDLIKIIMSELEEKMYPDVAHAYSISIFKPLTPKSDQYVNSRCNSITL